MLCILDGFGWRAESQDNAVRLGDTPNFDAIFAHGPSTYLHTDGRHVGLPDGQFGNSEVGHLNLGAGRVVQQDLPRIDAALADGSLIDSPAFAQLTASTLEATGRIHLLGLLSPGGVHAHQRHMARLAKALVDAGLDVIIHAVLDGRDTPPRSARSFLADWRDETSSIDADRLSWGTVGGRYFAMDRDRRWDRTELTFRAIVDAEAPHGSTIDEVIDAGYREGVTDEFIKPHVLGDYAGVRDGDALLCLNFRADRARQILAALVLPRFDGFARNRSPKWSACGGLAAYSDELLEVVSALSRPASLEEMLGEVVARAGLRQLRMAETEKYPHVTFFFNGGKERPLENEERILVPSPKVATYDLAPAMSAVELTDAAVHALSEKKPHFLLINFANPDMVGHTGILDAAIAAVETVDRCLGRLIEAALQVNASVIVTADHGNCEIMRDPATGEPHTSHTTNIVPCTLVNGPDDVRLDEGRLADIAPTILELLGINQPAVMTGRSLLRHE